MTYSITVTGKNQITIPADIARKLHIQPGDKLILHEEKNTIKLQKAREHLESLAGLISPPKKYKGKDIDFIIRDAKREFFSKKK